MEDIPIDPAILAEEAALEENDLADAEGEVVLDDEYDLAAVGYEVSRCII